MKIGTGDGGTGRLGRNGGNLMGGHEYTCSTVIGFMWLELARAWLQKV
jgi:hypothetical protein